MHPLSAEEETICDACIEINSNKSNSAAVFDNKPAQLQRPSESLSRKAQQPAEKGLARSSGGKPPSQTAQPQRPAKGTGLATQDAMAAAQDTLDTAGQRYLK